MATYASSAQIEERIGTALLKELTDDTDSGSIDADKVTEALEGASGLMDSYIGLVWSLPLSLTDTHTTGILETVCLNLASLTLFRRRPPVPNEIERAHGDATNWLRSVARGGAQLTGETKLHPTISNTEGPDRVMTRSALEDV